MKPPDEHTSEREFLEGIAQQYRADGYEVIVEPKSELPENLSDLHPDLLAKRGSERVVVGLKRRVANPNLRRLAEAVSREPGWRFDLVIYEPDLEDSGRPIKKESIKTALKDAERIADSNQLQVGLLAVSSAFEAAAVLALQKHGIERVPTAANLLKTLASEGLISDDEYNVLGEISRLRNRVAHGALEQPISREKFDTLLKFAYRLIDEPDVVAA